MRWGEFACSLHDVALFFDWAGKERIWWQAFCSIFLLACSPSVCEWVSSSHVRAVCRKNRDGSELAKCNSYQIFYYSWSICRFYDVEDSMILKNKATVTCINFCSWQAEKCTFVLIRNTSSLAFKFMMKLGVSVMNVPASASGALWSHM